MDVTDNTGKTARPERATAPGAAAATKASTPASDHPLGPDAAAIAATAGAPEGRRLGNLDGTPPVPEPVRGA